MKKALFVVGGWEGHQPLQSAGLFAGLLRDEGYEVAISESLDVYLDAEKLRQMNVIVPTLSLIHI